MPLVVIVRSTSHASRFERTLPRARIVAHGFASTGRAKKPEKLAATVASGAVRAPQAGTSASWLKSDSEQKIAGCRANKVSRCHTEELPPSEKRFGVRGCQEGSAAVRIGLGSDASDERTTSTSQGSAEPKGSFARRVSPWPRSPTLAQRPRGTRLGFLEREPYMHNVASDAIEFARFRASRSSCV